MPHTNTAAAAITNALRNKGKATVSTGADSFKGEGVANYGAVSQTRRKRGASGSSSGERLQQVPEDDDSESGGSPPAWAMRETAEVDQGRDYEDGDNADGGDDENEETLRGICLSTLGFGLVLTDRIICVFVEAYLRTKRLYILVPLSCLLFFVLFSSLPALIWPLSLPQSPSLAELSRSIILAAALWCLSHCLRVPSSTFVSSQVPVIFSKVLQERRFVQERATLWAPYIHSALFVTFQEVLRLTSFYILDIHWSTVHHRPHPRKHGEGQMYVFDRSFRIFWFLALGWALAEVCVGIVQGYEQLAAYSDVEADSGLGLDLAEGGLPVPFDEGSLENLNVGLGVSSGVAEERVVQAIPCAGPDADDSDLKGNSISGVVVGDRTNGEAPEALELDLAIVRFSNVKVREDLEAFYGVPFVRIPVFIAILQRLDSILLSLGITLTLGFAYMCNQSRARASPPNLVHLLSLGDRDHGIEPNPSHWRALLPTFIVLTSIHIFLGILHKSEVMSRIGVHVAAYIACLVGLGLVFAGIGMWVGLW